MDWTNDMVMQFLRKFATEPIIWDPRHVNHKRKLLVAEAWRRIGDGLPWECTVDDLKKKRDSLMAYYRIHLNKMKASLRSGEEVQYRTSWFAFETMNSFLGEIYKCSQSFNTENTFDEMSESSSESTKSTSDDLKMNHSSSRQTFTNKRHKIENVMINSEETDEATMQDTVISKKEKCKQRLDEYEMYGKLLAQKLMKLEEVDSLILMNKIDNLVFETTMKARATQLNTANTSNRILPSPSSQMSCNNPKPKKYKHLERLQSPEKSEDTYVLPEDAPESPPYC